LEEVLKFSQVSNPAFAKRLSKFLRYLYSNFRPPHTKLPNIEKLMSMMEAMVVFNERIRKKCLYPNKEIAKLKNALIMSICEYLRFQIEGANLSRLCDFVRLLAKNDTVLTFNWDTLLEHALEKNNIPLNRNSGYWYLPIKPKARVTILKPHGSINWFDRNQMPIRRQLSLVLGKNISVYRDIGSSRNNVMPYIIPPTINKVFETKEIMKIWKGVYRSLCRADEVFVIGYSFPLEDLHARFVFRTALRTNIIRKRKRNNQGKVRIVVVNPDPRVEATCESIVGTDFRFYRKRFEDLISDKKVLVL